MRPSRSGRDADRDADGNAGRIEDHNAVRSFIAIELPPEIRQALAQIEDQIQARAGSGARKAVRWVPPENMHLTLKFLGEVSTANLQTLARMLRVEVGRHSTFSFRVEGLGAFPNTRRPRVIWVGTVAPDELPALQRAIEGGTRQLGYPPEDRPFSPHLTLGRVTQHAHPDEVSQVALALKGMNIGEIGQVRVENLHLFRSELRPTGALYHKLYSFPLRTDQAVGG